ncbi:hypothetical protein OEA41_003050 [Lepraria neglecta]|uniref:Uncharacterized protein n=1 Tax=Lepraria neglecta TaxID=209136 RepID=A0AAE0DIM0_9LECA|nr:hypothetical protein OEA41_003050 [Lepraria neglecta]
MPDILTVLFVLDFLKNSPKVKSDELPPECEPCMICQEQYGTVTNDGILEHPEEYEEEEDDDDDDYDIYYIHDAEYIRVAIEGIVDEPERTQALSTAAIRECELYLRLSRAGAQLPPLNTGLEGRAGGGGLSHACAQALAEEIKRRGGFNLLLIREFEMRDRLEQFMLRMRGVSGRFGRR